MNDTIFADGMSVKQGPEKAPWVKAKVSIKVDAFVDFLNQHKNDGGWVNIDIKESKKGNLYADLNNYLPKPTQGEQKRIEAHNDPKDIPSTDLDGRDLNIEDIPF